MCSLSASAGRGAAVKSSNTHPMRARLGAWVVALCLPLVVEAKHMSGKAMLDSMTTELFIAKFAFSTGSHGVISVNSTAAAPTPACFVRPTLSVSR